MLGVLMVVGDFVSDQGTSKSLRIVIPCNFFLCLISLRTCAYHTKDQLHPKGGNTSKFVSMFEALIVVNVQLKIKYSSTRVYPIVSFFYFFRNCWALLSSPKGHL